MKKIIDGKVYNTETADSIGSYWNGYDQSDFHYEELTLYKTKKGSFFVAGESGPLGCFAKSVGNGFTSGGEGLFTLTREEALHHLAEQQRRVEAGAAYGELIRRVILEYAQAGNVLIAGRGGQVVLKDFANALHVRIHAPEDLRILRLTERLGLDQKEAERQIHQADKERVRYMKHFYDAKWDDPDLYHLVINTGKVSLDLATQIICDTAQRLARPVP